MTLSHRTAMRWRSLLFLAAAPVALTPMPTAAQAGDPDWYAIVDARIVPVSARPIDHGTIVVERGTITAIGRNVRVPAGAWVIDGTGLTVYPGLIDGMSSLGAAAPAPAAGRSGRPGAGPPGRGRPGGSGGGSQPPYSHGPEDRPATFTWMNAADHLQVDQEAFGKWRGAGFTTVVTAPDQGFFPGHAAVVNLGDAGPNLLVVKSPVALRFNLQGGPGHRGFPSSRPGVLAYFRQIFLDAGHYVDAWSRYDASPRGRERPPWDRALEGLRAVRTGTEPLLFPAGTNTEISRAIGIVTEMGVRPVLYGVQHGYEAADLLASHEVPVVVDLDWPHVPKDADPDADESLDVLRFRLLAPTTPARLAEAGVPFAFTAGGLRNPSEVLAAVRTAVEAGLDPDAAVRALTLSPAEIFGVNDRLGSLEEGKIANLTVTDGDLLGEETHVTMVFVDGRRFAIDESPEAVARGGRAGRGRPGGEGEGDEGETPGPSELRSLIGPSYRGPYRDDPVTMIRHATVLTVTNGTIENGDVILRNGKIDAVGTDLDVPRGATVIDATGQYVMPGIIDAHSHVAGGFNESSVAVSAMTRVRDNLNPDDISIYRALAGGVTTINVLHGSANPIGGGNAVIKLRWGSPADSLLLDGAPPGIKFALGENPKRDRNPDRYPATRMGVMDVIREAFVEAQEYQREWDAYRAGHDRDAIPPRVDLKLEALAEILRGERLVHAHSYRADEILQLIRLAEEFGFRIATFQHVLEGYKVAKEIAEHGAGASTFSDWWAYKVEAYDAIPYNAAIMVEKGVTVSINSDSNEEMRHLNEEAAKTVKWGGLTDDQALALITINPARQLGVDRMVGSLEVGKDADLVIYDRHPLDNFAVVQKTFVDGKLYFDIDGDRARQDAIQTEKARLKPDRKHRRATTEPAGMEATR